MIGQLDEWAALSVAEPIPQRETKYGHANGRSRPEVGAKISCRHRFPGLLLWPAPSLQPVSTAPHAFAVIDGALCQLTRYGGQRLMRHPPLATAVVDFRQGPLRFYVREHPYGFLPGLPNLYCLDGGFRLQWMADWPDADDPCAEIVSADGDTVVAMTMAGATVRLDANTGRRLSCTLPVAVAS